MIKEGVIDEAEFFDLYPEFTDILHDTSFDINTSSSIRLVT